MSATIEKTKLLLIDGNNLVHRAYHALPPLTVRKTGELVNAVYGFTSMLLKVINEQKPTHYAIAFDKKAPTFRHEMFEAYKANRPRTPDELVPQLERARQLVKAFNIPIYEIDGYEADDVLGALSRQASQQGVETLILTGDADTMQLVTPDVKVLYPKARQAFSDTAIFDATAVQEKYGVPPEHIADLKALVGDPSDNIPGVKGIGEKTAAKLISELGGIDAIYEHIHEVNPLKLQALLKQNEAIAHQSKELATIVTQVPISLNLDESRVTTYDRNKMVALLSELEFFTLINRLPEMGAGQMSLEMEARNVSEAKKDYRIVSSAEALDALAQHLTATGSFALDVVASSNNPMTAQLVGISLSPAAGEAYYIPLAHMSLEAGPQLTLDEVRGKLGMLFASHNIAKSAHNANFATTVLMEHGMMFSDLGFDTMLAAHLLGESSLELKSLALGKLGIELPPLPVGSGAKQIPVSQLGVPVVADYFCATADLIGRLTQHQSEELKTQELWPLFADVEILLVPVLVRMQRNGVLLDIDLLRQMSGRLGDRLTALEGEVYKCVGHQFNINSPRQLGPVLFEELKLPFDQRKKGGYSTEAAVLEALRGVHPVVDFILEYRQLTKLKSAYIDALPELVNRRTGRLHTSFNQTRTATGRLSSSDPNLQNIPVRGELGREIRQAFIAPSGSVLFSGDYSQIDLRALAHLSRDLLLMATFEKGEDIHSATAAQLFGVEPSKVTSDMRRLAKTVNFGVIYGMSGYGLEQATEFSREEANQFITAYFDKYPGVKAYLEATKKQAREKGYVQTILGRRRSIPEINSPNRILREAAERMAINMPVQGTSADIIKVAMLRLAEEMERRHLKSKLVLQVHDELIFEVPEEELSIMQELVPQLMAHSLELSVPIKVDVKIGCTWGQME